MVPSADTGHRKDETRVRHDNPDGIEFDETAADDIRTVECPFCGRRFPV
jgi:hypothetical protein